ncbi:hypothetical protein GXW82_09810 [Streptacidiphilus sp. 4-A2]|nr:hypothetical protein [Streptacidiphilus sp. 4-A2]
MSVAATPAAPGTAAAAPTKHAMLLGALGVLAFSLTLPATRVDDPVFDSWTVAFGRALPAALVAWWCCRRSVSRCCRPRRHARACSRSPRPSSWASRCSPRSPCNR